MCCHHDTLTIDRRFSRHVDDIQLIAVDNQSEIGAGRFVVSYDAGQTAIVWDLMTGDEISRFVSYETLTVAAWMRNGNVAFGNTQGNIILFEPTTSEHISARTIDQIAVTALAPSSDCRTFAIGYQNGSLLIATLQPRFTILHNLTTSRGPSPIVTLAWHASSSKQKSDMLAVQMHDGDLRVWSVAKSYNAEEPKVVRALRRNENYQAGPNWMGWSKNGRVIQYSDSETFSWDVRTRHVTRDSIPTLEHVKGIALYGPGASLFTLGPNNTVQQFDLNSPAIMVANVQHPAGVLPPSPPTSEEIGGRSVHSATTIHTSESESSSIPLEMSVSESDDDHLSPFQRLVKHNAPEVPNNEVYDAGSPASSRSGMSSLSKSSAGSRTPGRPAGSLRSRGMTEGTYISAGSSLKSSTVGRQGQELDNYSMGYSLPTTSAPSLASSKSKLRPSRLRHEVPRSPADETKVQDLFKYTRSRLSDLPYKHPIPSNYPHLTNDDLRRQMLNTIFGWNKEVDDLIRDEMSRHPSGSANRILLAKWLGDFDSGIVAASSQNMTSSDWMLLALSSIGGHASQHKLGRVYVQRLLENGDIHVAVTIMLGMGDFNDAIEVYISHKMYMEALILTCVAFPSVWERQVAIVKKWGEWAVKHGQQQLAIRCFACTDQESSEPWTSPSAAQLSFQNVTPSIPEVLSPPLSPPGIQMGPQRSVAKASALKLVTSFGDQNQKAKFYSQADGGQTPIAAGVTPIAESAISPSGAYDPATALLRPSNNSRFNTPTSARAGGQMFNRGRLPSIGESAFDRNSLKNIGAVIQPAEAPQEHRASHSRKSSATQDNNMTTGLAMQRAATASPMMMREKFPPVVQGYAGEYTNERPPSPDHLIMSRLQEVHAAQRNGSRDRIPAHLHLQLQPMAQLDAMSPEQSNASSNRYHWPTRRRGTGPSTAPLAGSVAGSITSNSSAGRSHRSNPRHKDDYIHSLEAAQYYSRGAGSRNGSKDRKRDPSTGRHASRERRAKSRDPSEDRGRASARSWTKPKRSPTSPVPMSPEDLAILSNRNFENTVEPLTIRKASVAKSGKGSGRTSSHGRSPDSRRLPQLETRERGSHGRSRSAPRSPTSPVPLSATALHYQGSEDEEDFRRAMQAQEEFRAKHSRSVGHTGSSPALSRRENTESRRKEVASDARDPAPLLSHIRAASTEHAGDLRKMKDERQRKKEQAARELEERRKSLAKRQLGPQIPHPSEIVSPRKPPPLVEADDEVLSEDLPPRSATEPPRSMYARNGPQIGLPATPKAMRLILQTDEDENDELPPPPVPTTFSQKYSPQNSPKYSPQYTLDKNKAVQKEEEEEQQQQQQQQPLTLLPSTVYQLPSTVYQPPTRPMIPRSMSAPIPEEPSQQPRFMRKGSANEGRGLDDIVETEWRRQRSDLVPPPPPPPPSAPLTFLKELQHLAVPPPPPPPPLPHVRRQPPVAGTVASGMIEIVMDDDETEEPMAAAPNDGMVPVIPPPEPPVKGHNRGRSLGEGSLSGRMSKATERLRSGSRSRKDGAVSIIRSPLEAFGDATAGMGHLRSPVGGVPPPVLYDRDIVRSPVEGHGRKLSTGMF